MIRPNGLQRRKDAEARYNRGLPHNALGKFQQTIEDVKAASRLEHKGAREFLGKEGVTWCLRLIPSPEGPHYSPSAYLWSFI